MVGWCCPLISDLRAMACSMVIVVGQYAGAVVYVGSVAYAKKRLRLSTSATWVPCEIHKW